MVITFRKIPPMTPAEVRAYVLANPMKAAAALANVQYVLAEMEATSEGRPWSTL